ncbi:MAG: lipoyl(octanoyl) transferase LipB [Candidatus Nanopelagicales bacterium]
MADASVPQAATPAALQFVRVDLGTRLIDYERAWELQRDTHESVASELQVPTVLMLEHSEVFTAGRRTEPADRPTDGSEVIEVDRGGRITWHGPGQLVCYPIVPLPHPLDVVAHVRRMESAIISTCQDFGITTETVEGRSGVWCAANESAPARKIAAIGVRVARGVTMHGLSLNVDCDLGWAHQIVPCGITDAGVTTMARELAPAAAPSMITVADTLEQHLREVFEPTLTKRPA